MKLTNLRSSIRAILIMVSGLDPCKVYWANQNMPKAGLPLMTLQLSGIQKVAFEELRPTCQKGVYAAVTPTEAVLTIQYFDKPGHFATDFLENLQQQLSRPSVIDICQSAGFSFFDAESVIDVTALLGNGQEFEQRASLDLYLRYASVAIDAPGDIEYVQAAGLTYQDGVPNDPVRFIVPESKFEIIKKKEE